MLFLTSIGGYNRKGVLRGMLEHVISNKVLATYSMKGRTGKKTFNKTTFFLAVLSKILIHDEIIFILISIFVFEIAIPFSSNVWCLHNLENS